MGKNVTIYDVAAAAGVSTATVTRVNAGDARVRLATRERVQQIIDEMGYVPSAAAHSLEGGNTHTIGVVIPNVPNPYFDRMYTHIYDIAVQNGYYTMPFRIPEGMPISREMVDEIIRRRLDGVIFVGNIWSSERSGLTDALARLQGRMPVVAVCPPSIHLDCVCVHSDLVNCSRLPVRHLHTLGHRRIAFLGGSMQLDDPSCRGKNFLEELRELDMPDYPEFHVNCGFDAESGARAVTRVLSSLPREKWPTGIIAFNDLVALGAMKQLHKMGLTLPDDMAVIGCDNQFFCAYTDPALTSVNLYPEEMASSAVRELLFTYGKSSSGANHTFSIVHEATLVIRESCGVKLGYRKLG